MSGAGTSTSAERLAERLLGLGRAAKSYHEFDADNPIRTKSSEAMKARYEQEGPLQIPETKAGENPFGSHQWGALAATLVSAPDRIVILESRYWQNSLFSRFLNGWDREKLLAYQERICGLAAPARPALLYLEYEDRAAVMTRSYPERTPEWRRWMQALFSDSVWCRRQGVRGEAAVLAAYDAWAPIADALFEAHRPHKLRLREPARDWQASMARLDAFLEIPSP